VAEPHPISSARKTTLTCPACREECTAEVWLIVDVAERPDLAERGRAGRLRHFECSAGHPLRVSEPLLLHIPGESPPLYFVGAEEMTNEEARVRCNALVDAVRERLGAAWDETWVQDGVPTVPWLLVPVTLTEGLAAAERLGAQLAAEFARLEALNAWLRAGDSQAAQRAVEQYPHLLSEGLDAFLGEQMAGAQKKGQRERYELLEERRALLRRCRELGVGPALAADDEFRVLLGAIDDLNRTQRQAARAEHLRQAIARLSRDTEPQLWATLHHELGYSLSKSGSGDRAENLEGAITAYHAALELRTPEAFPERWAQTQSNLGGAFADRVRGAREENLERAAAAYTAALTIFTRDAFPREWAQEQNNLGTVYAELGRLGRADDFQRAIDAYTAALEVRARDAFPFGWALTQNNLGNAWSDLPRGDRADNLDRAVKAHRAALEVFRRADFPGEWAAVQNNLGTAYADHPGEDRARNLEGALTAFQAALEVQTRDAFPEEWLTTQTNLAAAYAARVCGTRAHNLERAAQIWKDLIAHSQAAFHLSLDVRHLTVRVARLLRRLVPVLLELGRRGEALTLLEQGRAVGLRAELTRTHRIPNGLTEGERHDYRVLADRARELPSERRRLEALPLPPTERSARLADLGRQYEQTLTRLRELERRDPAFPVAAPSCASLAGLARRHGLTLVYLQLTDEAAIGMMAFVIHPGSGHDAPGEEDVIRLPGLSRGDFRDLLIGVPAGAVFAPEHAQALVEAGLQGGAVGWMIAYALDQITDGPYDPARASAAWRATMQRILAGLGRILTPLVERLRQVRARRVVLLAGGHLPLLPLHAAPVCGGPAGAEFLGDEFLISYAPSASSLAQCLRRAGPGWDSEPTLTALGNPDGSLPFATEEVLSVAARFGGRARVAHGTAGTRAWLDQHAPLAHYLALATHARFLPEAPERSSMMLAGNGGDGPGQGLLLDDLWRGQLTIRDGCIVTASACETGQVAARGESDESLGFPAAFLGLGASSVIASLWAVNDLTTALLMDKVYQRLLDGACPAAAVREAAGWLRRLSREEVRRWLDGRRADVAEKLQEFDTPQGGLTAERLAAEEALQRRLEDLDGALARLEGLPDPPFAHPAFWAAFAAYGA
jgi:CHAT domain-containing protein/tetratricopeptide (TPR) repeat protein